MIRHNLYPLNAKTIFDEMDKLMHSSFKGDTSYPPYNVYTEDNDETYIEIAVSGFKKENLKAYIDDDGNLCIEGTKEKEDKKYIHKSLSTKDFVRKFRLERYLEVQDIRVEDGLMTVKLSTIEPERKLLTIN
jgi:molecular chaperone IbpA